MEGKKIAIIATDYFEEVELTSPLEALQDAGAQVSIIAPKSGTIQGLNHIKPGKTVTVDKTIDQADPADFDAVVIPGGALNADHLRIESEAQNFVRAMLRNKKPTAVICHGPWLLVSADVVRGRQLTSYHTIRDDIENAGGRWVDKEVVIDDCLITSRKPADLPAFNEALLTLLQK